MLKSLINLCLFCVCSCKKFFCFLKFHLHCIPGCFCIIIFHESFCGFYLFCKNSCVCRFFCRFYNIRLCRLHYKTVVCITKCIYCQSPVSGSVSSLRKLATDRICKSKLDSHGFMHPVICGKLCSKRSQYVSSCSVISTIIPTHSLQVCSKISITIAINIYTKKLSVTSTCLFYCWCYIFCCFQNLILDSGICSCFSCLKCKAISIFYCIFQTIG